MLQRSFSFEAVSPAGFPAPVGLPSRSSPPAAYPSGPPPLLSTGSAEAVQMQSIDSIKVGVLLDGDADYFTRAYTSKGRQGGRCAALELKNNVERFIRHETLGNSKDVRPLDIIAFSFVNMKGLTRFIGDDIASFAQGFNSSPYAFTMSDLGEQSQGADTALKSHLPFLLSTCDYVLFGGSHDNGYHELLSNLITTCHRDKVILLRTTPYCAEKILLLGLNEARFPMLFEGRDPTERARTPSALVAEKKVSRSMALGGLAYSTVVQQSLTSTVAAQHTAPLAPTPSTKVRDYKPLVRVLLARLALPVPEIRPLYGGIAYELQGLPNSPIAVGVKGEFTRYAREAMALGLVKLGVGDVEGSEWIKLAISPQAAREFVDGDLTASNTPVASASAPNSATSAYRVLVDILRSKPNGCASFSIVSSTMVDRGARAWPSGKGAFAAYIQEANAEGIVTMGKMPGEKHELWVKLKPKYQSRLPKASEPSDTSLVSPTPSSTSVASCEKVNSIPVKFLPLIEEFTRERVISMTPHSLVARMMMCRGTKPFETGQWQKYINEAEQLGLVKFSTAGPNQLQWITLQRPI
ncbi:uncharacterized protein JCM15063_006041 [Sporobolomyces koalae]|uniref:uncharacterized protein n=1 Tax=Sporobolomyces koalae TaxID=500713 RepID=UPI0031820EDC